MSGYGGGISSHIRNIAREIDVSKVTFDVIGFTDYPEDFIKEISHTGGKTFTFLKPKKVGFKKFYQDAVSIIKKNGPYDVVLCHTSGNYSLVFKMMSLQAGTKRFVVHAHKTQYDDMHSLKAKIKVKADQLFSRFTANQLTSCSTESSLFVFGDKPVKNQEVIHIPNSIPLDKYMLNLSVEEIRTIKVENKIPLDRLIIGNMGRFNLQKNHEFMVRLIEYMAQKNISFTWVFIGAGELEEKIKTMVKERNLSDYVIFLGRREDGNRLYQVMDVFVLPSFYEGLPTVIVETQAAGIQAVVSDTITREVDLGLGMVTYLPLGADLDIWSNQIVEASRATIAENDVRRERINEKGFSNVVAAKLYEDFLFGKIERFRIGDTYKVINH